MSQLNSMDFLQRLDFISLGPNFQKELWLFLHIDFSLAESFLNSFLLVVDQGVKHNQPLLIDKRDLAR